MFNKTVISRCLLVLMFATATVAVSAKTDPKAAFTDDKNFPSLLTSSAQSPALVRMADSLYNLMGLSGYGLERDVFYSALKGYHILDRKGLLRKKDILTICDYGQSSSNKRLYVIDMANGRLLFNTYVSHGKNSGSEFATSFSNMVQSNKSSLGFMLTGETYNGKAGYSMRFDGMEAGINDKVRTRDIVLHGSNFVNARMVSERGAVGNSLGCPAVPNEKRKQIIDAIKGGSCFYVNHPDTWYARTSSILNARFDLVPALVPSPAMQASTLNELSENNSGKTAASAALQH